jgi:hypothetical protein
MPDPAQSQGQKYKAPAFIFAEILQTKWLERLDKINIWLYNKLKYLIMLLIVVRRIK